MSTSITHESGTLLSASPPRMRPRLIEGRSNRSELSRANGSDSIARKTSSAFRIALSPSHGVEPCAAVPATSSAQREHALRLDADVQVGGLAGDREVAAQSPRGSGTSVPRSSSSSDSSSGTHDEAHAHFGLRRAAPGPRPSSPPARPSCRRRRGRRGGRPRRGARTARDGPGTTSRWPWRITVGARASGRRRRPPAPAGPGS